MPTKQHIIISLSLLIGACLIAGASLYANGKLSWFRGSLPNCLRLRDGNVAAEIHYPDTLVPHYDANIRLYRPSDLSVQKDDSMFVVGMLSGFADVLEGPKVTTKQTT